jgi:hypothetical protein
LRCSLAIDSVVLGETGCWRARNPLEGASPLEEEPGGFQSAQSRAPASEAECAV